METVYGKRLERWGVQDNIRVNEVKAPLADSVYVIGKKNKEKSNCTA